MFGRKTWEKRFRDVGKELIKTAVFVNGLRVMEELPGVGVSFSVDNPRVKAWIKDKVFKFAYEVNETTERQLRKALVDAINAGGAIKEIQSEVKRIFGDAKGYRNERIARTETIGATNLGAYEAIKQSGLVARKEWIATLDERTRDSHDNIDGESVELDDTFSNGLKYPGDPDGELSEFINCRCTIGHIFPEDDEWNS
jgi:SPP1 gp7 family putative phage head morphogenesis protein